VTIWRAHYLLHEKVRRLSGGSKAHERISTNTGLIADEGRLLRRRGVGGAAQGSGDAKHRWKGGGSEEEGGGTVAAAGRRDEHPALVLLGLILVGDDDEAELLREPGDRLVMVADDQGDMGEGYSVQNEANLSLAMSKLVAVTSRCQLACNFMSGAAPKERN
jgi:hypothetical protein